MVKGVNRAVIEVRDRDNPMFERVICFVRPEYSPHGYKDLKVSAEKYVETIIEPEEEKESRLPLILKISVPTVTAAIGFAIGVLIG